jgi:DNA-binding GntR family transcriptional regulator
VGYFTDKVKGAYIVTAMPDLSDGAYVAIREQILRGKLRPGAPLAKRQLAEQLGTTVVGVSDALRRLENEHLVETRGQAGARVRVYTDEDVRELYELREALETQAARLFSQRATPAQRLELRRLAEQIDVLFCRLAADPDDPEFRFTVHQYHVQFHLWIAEHARSPLLRQLIEHHHVLILNWLFDLSGRRTPLPAKFHARLAEALISKDVEHADAAMRAHVRYGLAEVSGRIGLAATARRAGKPRD